MIFTPMSVNQILMGNKTQTRRVLSLRGNCDLGDARGYDFDLCRAWVDGAFLKTPYKCPADAWEDDPAEDAVLRVGPKWAPGDILYVKEPWMRIQWVGADGVETTKCIYKADDPGSRLFDPEGGDRWGSPLFMPKDAARLTLRVTKVRPERLNDMTESDAEAEGYQQERCGGGWRGESGLSQYRKAWESINGAKHPWGTNPWVWVIDFEPYELDGVRL